VCMCAEGGVGKKKAGLVVVVAVMVCCAITGAAQRVVAESTAFLSP
jgi:hypothetical protein